VPCGWSFSADSCYHHAANLVQTLGVQPPFTTRPPPFTLWPQRREGGGEGVCEWLPRRARRLTPSRVKGAALLMRSSGV
jgi:hypothetical protein